MVEQEEFVPHLNSNRLLGFYGNLCGSIASFFFKQAEKYGDWYEVDLDNDPTTCDDSLILML